MGWRPRRRRAEGRRRMLQLHALRPLGSAPGAVRSLGLAVGSAPGAHPKGGLDAWRPLGRPVVRVLLLPLPLLRGVAPAPRVVRGRLRPSHVLLLLVRHVVGHRAPRPRVHGMGVGVVMLLEGWPVGRRVAAIAVPRRQVPRARKHGAEGRRFPRRAVCRGPCRPPDGDLVAAAPAGPPARGRSPLALVTIWRRIPAGSRDGGTRPARAPGRMSMCACSGPAARCLHGGRACAGGGVVRNLPLDMGLMRTSGPCPQNSCPIGCCI